MNSCRCPLGSSLTISAHKISLSIDLLNDWCLSESACMKWFTNNQATARTVDVGNMKLQLRHLAYNIFSYCSQHNIDLHVQWVRQADFISKIKDCDDWQHTVQCFDTLESMWGPHSLDCFVSYCNVKPFVFFLLLLESRYSWSGCLFSVMGRGKLFSSSSC